MNKRQLIRYCSGVASYLVMTFAQAAGVVSADQIVKSLTTVPKAMIGADGRITQPDPTLDLQVAFFFNKSSLTAEGKSQLDQLAYAFSNPALAQARFELAGHTDQVGTAESNLKLSTDRANTVRDYLHNQHGVALERMLTQGYGFTRLADPQNPKSAANRRVEIRHLLAQTYGAGVPAAAATPAPQYAPVTPQYVPAAVPAVPPAPAQPGVQPQYAPAYVAPSAIPYGGQIIQRP